MAVCLTTLLPLAVVCRMVWLGAWRCAPTQTSVVCVCVCLGQEKHFETRMAPALPHSDAPSRHGPAFGDEVLGLG